MAARKKAAEPAAGKRIYGGSSGGHSASSVPLTTLSSVTGATNLDMQGSATRTFDLTLTGAATLTPINAPSGAAVMNIIQRQDATGGRVATYAAAVHSPYLLAPAFNVAASGVEMLTLVTTNGGTTWQMQTSAPETWHVVGAAGEPAFTNSWVNFNAVGGGFAVAGFRKTASGLIVLKGMIKSGTIGQPAFTLPAVYAPAAETAITDFDFAAESNNLFGRLTVESNGKVTPLAGSNLSFSLAGAAFYAT